MRDKMNKKVILNDGDYKEGDILKSIKTVETINEDSTGELETRFYYELHADLELSDPLGSPIYCTFSIKHQNEINEDAYVRIQRGQQAKLAKRCGLTTVSEMEKYIKCLTKEEYDEIMTDE